VSDQSYDQIVFSGGGTRCFWQGGFMEVLGDHRPLTPARVAGVSGGALAAAAFLSGRAHELHDEMARRFERQEANIAWHDREAGSGLTPHQRIYREVVEAVLDAEAQEKIAAGPKFQVLLAHPPISGLPKASGVLSAIVYEAELHLLSRGDGRWPKLVGTRGSLVDACAVAAEGRLVELVTAAATIPPVFEPPLWDGRPVIDGGMVSQIPVPKPDEGRTLVLLTRSYDRLPQWERCSYAEPSEAVPADKIDFTDPEKIRQTWRQGEEDARAFLERAED
jgi:predicted acylesterase/phospholipase RssA